MDERIGTVVKCNGRTWQLTRCVGHGTCSSVYEAHPCDSYNHANANKTCSACSTSGNARLLGTYSSSVYEECQRSCDVGHANKKVSEKHRSLDEPPCSGCSPCGNTRQAETYSSSVYEECRHLCDIGHANMKVTEKHNSCSTDHENARLEGNCGSPMHEAHFCGTNHLNEKVMQKHDSVTEPCTSCVTGNMELEGNCDSSLYGLDFCDTYHVKEKGVQKVNTMIEPCNARITENKRLEGNCDSSLHEAHSCDTRHVNSRETTVSCISLDEPHHTLGIGHETVSIIYKTCCSGNGNNRIPVACNPAACHMACDCSTVACHCSTAACHCSTVARHCSTATSHSNPCHRNGRVAVKVYKAGAHYESAGINELHIMQAIRKLPPESQLYFVNLLHYTYFDSHLCLITNLLPCNLSHILLKSYPGQGLPLYIIHKCCRDLAHALSYLEQLGIVHGDIKPSNIMWNADKEVFVLGDFGLSFLEENQPVQPIQSPGYQSPEAVVWNKMLIQQQTHCPNGGAVIVSGCSHASDMWSFGCLLYRLYTGEKLHAWAQQTNDEHLCDGCKQGKPCTRSCCVLELACARDELDMSFTDLLSRMLQCLPEARIKPDAVLLHPFLNEHPAIVYPSLCDLLLLPTRVLQLTNMFADAEELSDTEEYEDFMTDVRDKCSCYGDVSSLCVPHVQSGSCTGKVFVEFEWAEDCEQAQQSLSGKTFNGRTVVTSFFPHKYYRKNRFF